MSWILKTILVVLAIIIPVVCLFLWAAVAVGSKADDEAERIYKQHMKEKEDAKSD